MCWGTGGGESVEEAVTIAAGIQVHTCNKFIPLLKCKGTCDKRMILIINHSGVKRLEAELANALRVWGAALLSVRVEPTRPAHTEEEDSTCGSV